MENEVNIFRKTREMPDGYPEKFEGTFLENYPHIQSAILRLLTRIEDQKIQSDTELHYYLKSDYWDSDGMQRVFLALIRSRISFDFENFEILPSSPNRSECPVRGAVCKNDNEVLLAILREEKRVEHGPRLPAFLEKKFEEVKKLYQKDYPFNLPDGIVYDWLIADSLKRHLSDPDYRI